MPVRHKFHARGHLDSDHVRSRLGGLSHKQRCLPKQTLAAQDNPVWIGAQSAVSYIQISCFFASIIF
jgi:hypothetical protein